MVNLEADLYDFIRDSIRHWVGKNFGSQEVEEPSWNIDDLSDHLAKAINKRNNIQNHLLDFEMVVLTKENSDEERTALMDRIKEKVERIGGVFLSYEQEKKKFDMPIEGETKGYRIKAKLEMPCDAFRVRALDRWLERQIGGDGGMVSEYLNQTGCLNQMGF